MDTVTLTLGEATALCERAAIAAGACLDVALSIARSAVAAEADGQPSVGLAHFVDYLEALEAGRIDGKATPRSPGRRPRSSFPTPRAGPRIPASTPPST